MVRKLSMFSHDAIVYVGMTLTAVFYCQKRYELELVRVGELVYALGRRTEVNAWFILYVYANE